MIRGFLDAGGVRGMGVRAWNNLGIWLLRMKCMGFASCIIWKKTADPTDAGYRPPRPVAVAHLRSRPAAAAALWSHKKMGNTFWQRQSGCGSSSPLGESDALPCLRGLRFLFLVSASKKKHDKNRLSEKLRQCYAYPAGSSSTSSASSSAPPKNLS